MEQVKNLYNRYLKTLDPRYIVILNHTILLLTAVLFFDLRRGWDQITLSVGVAIISELIFSRITGKQRKFDVKDRILSALILGLSTVLLVRSSYWWFYGLIAFFGVASKYLLVNDRGRHVFNPTNVAIVFAIIILPEFMYARADSFSVHIFSLCCIAILGTIACIKAGSWRISLGYYLGVCLFGTLGSFITGYPFLLVLGPELNVGVILFALLMITDPQTSPREVKLQWLFGLSIAAINMLLRFEQLYYAPFIALFIVLSFSSLFYGPSAISFRKFLKRES